MSLELMYRLALDTLDDAVIISDEKGSIVYLNPASEALIGRRRQDALHRGCHEILGDCCRDLQAILGEKDCRLCGIMELNGQKIDYRIAPVRDGEAVIGSQIILKRASPAPAPRQSDDPPGGKWLIPCCDAQEDLRKRDRVLAGAALATNQLIITKDMDLAISQALEILGCSADVDRVFLFENYEGDGGEHLCRLKSDWISDAFKPVEGCLPPYSFSYGSPFRLYDALASGMTLKGLARDLPEPQRALLEGLNVLSYLIVPIFAKDSFWGFIGFDDRKSERIWTWGEVSVLITMASAIGGLVDRWMAEMALRNSEEKYRELVEGANSIIMRLNIRGNITFQNKFAQTFFGYAPDDILERSALGTIVPEFDSEGRDQRNLMTQIMTAPRILPPASTRTCAAVESGSGSPGPTAQC